MSRPEPSDVSSLHARLVWFGLALQGALLDWAAVMSTISSIRLARIILVFRAAHSLAAGKSLRRRFGRSR